MTMSVQDWRSQCPGAEQADGRGQCSVFTLISLFISQACFEPVGKEFEEEEEDEHKRKKRSSEDGDGADEDEVLTDLINLLFAGQNDKNLGSNSRVNHTTSKPDDKRQAGLN